MATNYINKALDSIKKHPKCNRTISLRLSTEMVSEINELAKTHKITQTDFIRWAIEQEMTRWKLDRILKGESL